MKSFIMCASFLLMVSTNLFAAGIIIKTDSANATAKLKSKRKTILTFVGYSGKGYKNLKEAMGVAFDILNKYDPKKTIVNIGVTAEGVGQVYCIAKSKGFETSGIVSTLAEKYITDENTKCVDVAFIIEDKLWGGKDEFGNLSPTSAAMVKASTVVVRLGGGEVALIEAAEAKVLGKKVITFEMESGTKQPHEKFLDP